MEASYRVKNFEVLDCFKPIQKLFQLGQDVELLSMSARNITINYGKNWLMRMGQMEQPLPPLLACPPWPERHGNIEIIPIRRNQLPDSATRWQHGSHIYFETFIL